ncbi:Unannotated [Lentimonas sp. CC4]|nr:Unannotated [Lentimonas sp. CC4]CAA6685378.1 Unannotated [Lentimonas sp. CC6]CAA7074898.1 Unannotated [Lentimonas sp. CC4]CAA7169523.1 Unannotated [Lentimonas sp. CC21]CAA7182716.1 Unannotated [Lentimonas sp. CC8]
MNGCESVLLQGKIFNLGIELKVMPKKNMERNLLASECPFFTLLLIH